MALSKRLFSIFSMIEKGSIVADIGCDHGLLSIALIHEGVAKHVYACDLRKGPLSRAQQAIETIGYNEHITTMLCDGLASVPDDVDTIVIAGMGQETIQGILENRMELVKKAKRIIVQANKHVDEMRRWISEHHFTILDEDIVEEDHFYEIVCFHSAYHDCYSEDEILFGKSTNNDNFLPYWKHRLHKTQQILSCMPKSESAYETYVALEKRIRNKIQVHNHFVE